MVAWSSLKRFLRLFGFFSESSTPDVFVTPNAITDSERLSRYVSENDHFRPAKPVGDRLHFRAFLPSRKHPDELSIARTHDLSEEDIWSLGERMITEQSGRPVIARGDITASQIVQVALPGTATLRVRPDEPPERHALVFNWPPVDDADARKSYAQQLRAAAKPVQRP
jgi:hypothetical protein